MITGCIISDTTCKYNEKECKSNRERASEAMLLEEMSERVDRKTEKESDGEEGRHLEGSGHTCHFPFI